MSNTYKDKIKGKIKRGLKRIIKEKGNLLPPSTWYKYWNNLSIYEHNLAWNPYKNRSWFNRLFNNIPKRRKDKIILTKIKNNIYIINNNILLDDYYQKFSLNKKPCKWYW